jgi:Protein of unknown function (DUF3300)
VEERLLFLKEAFLDQPADVMNSIQGLRAEAVATGSLTYTPQQHVVQEKTCIRIMPAQPDVIYAQNVGPLPTFGAGFAVGSWLSFATGVDHGLALG